MYEIIKHVWPAYGGSHSYNVYKYNDGEINPITAHVVNSNSLPKVELWATYNAQFEAVAEELDKLSIDSATVFFEYTFTDYIIWQTVKSRLNTVALNRIASEIAESGWVFNGELCVLDFMLNKYTFKGAHSFGERVLCGYLAPFHRLSIADLAKATVDT